MRLFLLLMNPVHRNKKDLYNLIIREKLKSAFEYIRDHEYVGKDETRSCVLLPTMEDHELLDPRWRSWIQLLRKYSLPITTIEVGKSFSLLSTMRSEMGDLAEVVANNRKNFENIVLPLPKEVIEKFVRNLKSITSGEPWRDKIDRIYELTADPLMTNGSVIMIDMEAIGNRAIGSYREDYIQPLQIPECFFPSGFIGQTEDNKNTLTELERLFREYVRSCLLQSVIGEPSEMMITIENEVKKLPLQYEKSNAIA